MGEEELRALAEAATPGPWEVHKHPAYDNQVIPAFPPDPICDTTYGRDAAYIAAVNPAAVLPLLDSLASLRAENERLRAVAHRAWHLLDESGEGAVADGPTEIITPELLAHRLSDALDELEASGWSPPCDDTTPASRPSEGSGEADA